ncbi:hypothetical protein ACFONG_03520 [Uliginosibacterium paludis]|jgi:hypothetical protein|uniref:Uncharacterized protein n=1 Tax=Uliginosibacterium paludis TaxID=1615952 RepID=A0ABV2CNT5_9RHOO
MSTPAGSHARSEADKARRTEALRQRLAAATPPTRRPALPRFAASGRSLAALALLLILLLVWLR